MLWKAPYLYNPAPGWTHDLPAPDESPDMRLIKWATANPINHIDDYYLEIPSPSMTARGLLTWIGLMGIAAFGSFLWIIASIALKSNEVPFYFITMSLIFISALVWFSIHIFRLDLFLPRDEPIRFNRARQKVYIYHFRYSWLHPLSKTKWGVEISVHNWDELWLEACTAYGSLEYGGSIQRVQISAQKNRTRDKRNSRIFSHSIRTGEEYWATIRLFMQQGQQALPPFKNPPQPREDEEMFYNIFWDYAPRVVWPADIDLESRTGPEHDVTLPFD